jgi:SAM-dependent methyltransferase
MSAITHEKYIACLNCPICTAPFDPSTSTQAMLVCVNAHTFDIAREGYVNLLRKKLSGDTKEMMLARRAFFDQDFYRPISDALNALLLPYIATMSQDKERNTHGAPITFLDAGCGEGYYLGRFLAAFHAHYPQDEAIALGLDISKEALRMAAKRYKDAFFVVANLKEPHLVIADACCDLLFNIFAPRNPAEFARILRPGGLLCIALPDPSHLQELRAALPLLTIEENKRQHVIEQFSSHFTLLTTDSISYQLHLTQENVQQLVMMTPNYWHLSAEIREAITHISTLTTTIAITFLLFQ